MATCRSCGASIVWTLTDSGKRMPVDAEPTDGGNVFLWRKDGEVRAMVLGALDTVRTELDNGKRYTSHFVTCPDAAEHRRDTRSGGRR